MLIEDGTGGGYKSKVTQQNELKTAGESRSIQHEASKVDEQAYQVIGTATLSSGTVVPMHLKNTSATKKMVITYIRHQVIDQSGGTAIPNASNYFSVRFGRTYSSGGTEVTPVNVNRGSGNAADATTYNDDPTLAGTATEIDRWYTKAEADMNIFVKEGSVIIKPNNTIELAYVGDQSSGTIYARLSFIMVEDD